MTITLHDLFNQNIPLQYKDKIFWYAHHISMIDMELNIYINSNNFLVAFDDIAEKLKIKSISELSKPNSLDNILSFKKPVLVSSGVFLFLNKKLLVTQRNNKTKYDPLHWTSPAGRCDNLPYRTALKEAFEEIHVFSKETQNLLIPKPVLPYVKIGNVEYYDVVHKFPEEFETKNMYTVNTWIDNQLCESKEMWFFYNPNINTIELRIPMSAELRGELYFINPEFNTEVKLLNCEEIKKMQLVPALRKLIS